MKYAVDLRLFLDVTDKDGEPASVSVRELSLALRAVLEYSTAVEAIEEGLYGALLPIGASVRFALNGDPYHIEEVTA